MPPDWRGIETGRSSPSCRPRPIRRLVHPPNVEAEVDGMRPYWTLLRLACGQDDTEARVVAHHACVAGGSLLQRHDLVHGADVLEDAETQSVLAVLGGARQRAADGARGQHKIHR